MKRRFELAIGVALISAFLTVPAYAYLDAGSVSMALQVVVGAVASALVVAKVYLSRIVGFFRRGSDTAAEVQGKAEHR
jgi:hypothetical protein